MLARVTFSWKLAEPMVSSIPAACVPGASRPLSASHWAAAAAESCCSLMTCSLRVMRSSVVSSAETASSTAVTPSVAFSVLISGTTFCAA